MIATIWCGNKNCTGKIAINEDGSWKSIGTHNHPIDERGDGCGFLDELKGKTPQEKVDFLLAEYGPQKTGMNDLELFIENMEVQS